MDTSSLKASLITPENTIKPDSKEQLDTIAWISILAYDVITYIPTVCASTFRDLFIDGNSPWRQEIFKLSLSGIQNAFENEHTPLVHIKSKFLSNDVTPTQTAVLSVIDALDSNNPQSLQTPELQSQHFIDQLRYAIQLDGDIEYSPFLEKICFYRFTEVQIFDFCQNLIHSIIQEGMRVTLLEKDLCRKKCQSQLFEIPLIDQFKYIAIAPQSTKAPLSHLYIDLIKGGCNIFFDAQRGSNVPYALFDFSITHHSIRVLRTGSPTMQRYNYETFTYHGDATITKEFEMFIENLWIKGKKLLFVGLQDKNERIVGSEHQRIEALIKLHEKFPKTFILIVLAHDSEFYHQTEAFKFLNSADEFKERFLSEMQSAKGGFYFPENFKNWEVIKILLDEVHADLYLDKTVLSLQERLNFIEIFYTRITFKFLSLSKVDYLINCCKDSIDRAAIRNTLLQYLLLIFYKKENSPEHLNQLYTYLHAGAFLVKKRSLNSRKDRLLEIFKLLESEEIKSRLFARKDVIGIDGDDLLIQNSMEGI
jgi:hypothetical protein